MRENNYTMELLNEVIADEEAIKFASFENDDAIDLFNLFFKMGREHGYNVCCQIMIGDFVVARGFGNKTDDSNVPFLFRKTNSVYKSGKSSLRCGMEIELLGAKEDWHEDADKYLNRGGAYPIKLMDGTVVGAICVSGLWHVDDHIFAVEVLKAYQEMRNN